jgi:hypothetical protein
MRRALMTVTLGLALVGCDKAPDAASTRRDLQPVGSSGASPATAPEAKPKDNASVTPATKTDPAPDPVYREVTVPAGTILPLDLSTAVASDTSSVEDPIRATLRRAITIGGVEVLPAGAVLTGHVTDAKRSARVKGRGRIAFRFNQIDLRSHGGRTEIRTATVAREAPGTKKKDATKIGIGAAGGAIVGGLIGGGDGAAKGAAVGGGAGTAAVLATRGEEVRLGEGADLSVRLTAPLTVRVPVK